jgi:hypothetical protein
MHYGEVFSVIIAAGGAIVAVVALRQTVKTNQAQQRLSLLVPRLHAYDSAVAIARQIEQTAQLRFFAKIGSDAVEEGHSTSGSTAPNHFAKAYEDYSQQMHHQVEQLKQLNGQSYFPDEFSNSIRSFLAASNVRNDVAAGTVHNQWREIQGKFRALQIVHEAVTRVA